MTGRQRVGMLLAAVTIAAPGVVILEAGTADASGRRSLPACELEDGSGQRVCVWDGRHRGNGRGQSVIIRHGGTDDASVTVIRHRRAHRLTH